jgi:predicted Zn-dependent protease
MNPLKDQFMWYMAQRKPSRRRLLRLVPIILAFVAVACASVPHTGRRQFNVVSDEKLNALGLKVFDEIVMKEPQSKNERVNASVKKVADNVIKAAERTDRPKFDWKVAIIEDDTPNAFCLPGGKIVVCTGILPHAKNEAGLAAIIAHEIAHAVTKHGAERLSQKLALEGALSIGGEVLRGEDGAISTGTKLTLSALGMGGTVGIILPYSRTHEFEADRIGQIYMAAAGYDPEESVRLWDRMSKIKKPPIPIWLSTHPADADRIKKLKEFLPDAMKYYRDAATKYGVGGSL